MLVLVLSCIKHFRLDILPTELEVEVQVVARVIKLKQGALCALLELQKAVVLKVEAR
jgi:hypothetical protein